MAAIIYTVLLVVSFLLLVRKKVDDEFYFPLKIIGYLILGSFAFNINEFSLPLGFVIFLLFFRPKLNAEVKRTAAIYGLILFILVHWLLPPIIEGWENRSTYIGPGIENVYNQDFQEDFHLIEDELKLEEQNVKLESFRLEYDKSGKIRDLGWQLIDHNGEHYSIYYIYYEKDKSRYRINKIKTDHWAQYDRLIVAERFFDNLKVLDIEGITEEKGSFSSYVIQSTGEYVNYGMNGQPNFIISNGQVESIQNDTLPVNGYFISTFAMKKTGEERDEQGNLTQESYESTEVVNYLFDVYSEE